MRIRLKYGDGEQTRSFLYIDDCVEGTLGYLSPIILNL